MRIAHIITRLIIGGAQENTLLTCAGLAARGHDVALMTGPETGPEGSLWSAGPNEGVDLVTVEAMRRSVKPLMDLRCLRDLTRLLREGEFDIVHTHSSKAGILGRLAAKQARIPIIVHTIHGMSFNRTQPAAVQRLYRMLERRAARFTDSIVTVADAMTRQSLEAGVGRADQFETIRSGMDVSRFGPDPAMRERVRSSWGFEPGSVVIGTVARLFRHKGYEHLLEAMPRIAQTCPRARFVWVGDGAQRPEYEQKLKDMGLREKVHLTGLLPPAEVPAMLTGMDVLVHASEWEGLPRVLVQASLTEVPCVSFDNDGAPEVVREGETGRLAPLGDDARLADCVIDLVRDEQERVRLGKAARAACLAEFPAEVMVERIEALYERLRKAGPTGRG